MLKNWLTCQAREKKLVTAPVVPLIFCGGIPPVPDPHVFSSNFEMVWFRQTRMQQTMDSSG
jgi:hypothetical protein